MSGRSSRRRLLIIQPYVPDYRVPLFAALSENLAEAGFELALAAAVASGDRSHRGDDATALVADYLLTERVARVGGRSLLLRSIGSAMKTYRPNFVIVEQAIKNLEAWPLILRSSMGGQPRVAMWGQGRSYSTSQSEVEARAKSWLTRRSDWFFAYTEAGAGHVVSEGFPPERVTILKNATNTTALRQDLSEVTRSDVAAFACEHGLTLGKTALFMGGVDEHKGIRFLLDAARDVGERVSDFRLLVAGSGALSGAVREAEEEGAPVVALGRVTHRVKALAMASADIMMVPEWVGLVAVDALAGGVPVVTTRHPSHSPEFEYLTEGLTAVVTAHDIEAYARAAERLLLDPLRRSEMTFAALQVSESLSIELMAKDFAEGIKCWTKES